MYERWDSLSLIPSAHTGCAADVRPSDCMDSQRKVVCSLSDHALHLQRKRFCRYYLRLGNAEEAALRAGFPVATAFDDALQILETAKYRNYLETLAAQPALPIERMVLAGLSRLAFGAANDAARLVCAETLPSAAELATLDLFQVSELKRDKGGGVEVKLFDRQRAMERLLAIAASSDAAATTAALLSALHPAKSDSESDKD